MRDHAVIFDCDGVLVDSERLAADVVREMAAELRIVVDDVPVLEFIRGRKVADWAAELAGIAGRPLPDDFVEDFRARCAAAFDAELESIDGVERVLEGLDMPYCCASSSPRDKIEHALAGTGLLPFFPDRIYSAYEIGSWKPDPGLFLHAAHDLAVDPARCAVVEDSVPGVLAGVRAGMTVFGYAPRDEGAGALRAHGAEPFRAMDDLPRLLDEWAPARSAPCRT